MKLRPYFAALTLIERNAFSARVGSTRGHLQNVAYGYRPCGPILANAIEKDTGGVVSRREMCPDDYHLIWPDLAPDFGVGGSSGVSANVLALVEKTTEAVAAKIYEKLARQDHHAANKKED